MATTTLNDVPVTGTWTDLVVTHASLASVDAAFQNVGGGAIALVFGGGSAPTAKSGTMLGPRESCRGNAAHVWARSIDADGVCGVTLL